MRLSVIIPCYNESANLPQLLQRCGSITQKNEIEVILVDNGSTDDSERVLRELLPQYPGCRSVRIEKNQGYGFGILSGLRAAEGEILSWTHADLQTDPRDIVKGLEYFDSNGPEIFVKGKRFGRPIGDTIFTIGMSLFETVLLQERLFDINAQPTMFSKKFFTSWNEPPHDFSLDLFAYYHAKRSGLPIFRFPVNFGARVHGVSHWNINWKAKMKFIRRTIAFSFILRRSLHDRSEQQS